MANLDAERLDAVCEELGEAAIDPKRWPILMEGVRRAVGTIGAALLQSHIHTHDTPMTASMVEVLGAYFYNDLHLNDVRAVRGVPLLIPRSYLFKSERDMFRDPLYANFRWPAAKPRNGMG